MNSAEIVPHVDAVPEDSRLARRAKAGDADAFIHLFDAYSDDIYRYIYFRVMNDVAAEAITSHVFRYAWEHLDSYPKGSSFVTWIYKIVRNQVIVYYNTNIRNRSFHVGFLSVAADYGLHTEPHDWASEEAWRNHLRLLATYRQQRLLQTTNSLIMRRYLDYLNPGREVKPSPTFNAYTRTWLTRYLQFHERKPKQSPVVQRASLAYAAVTRFVQVDVRRASIPALIQSVTSAYTTLVRSVQLQASRFKTSPLTQRMAFTYAMLVAATLFVTGTAGAQGAMPGDALYIWKRGSEQAWLAVSPDPVGTEIILADRRLGEWIAVKKDPARSATALDDYFHAINDLNSVSDAASNPQARARIAPVLASHKEQLSSSGLASLQVDNFLASAANPTPTAAPTEVALGVVLPTATASPTRAAPTPTAAPTQVQPTATAVPTQILPTASATAVPTEVPPTATATAIPTEVPPTPTDTATEVPPTETDTPTEVPPTPTDTATPTTASAAYTD